MTRRAPISLLLAAAMALVLLVPSSAGAAIERTVSVSASATLKVANDSAGFGFAVSQERRSRGAALRAVSGQLRSVIAAVQGIPGVGEGDVRTGRIVVRKTFRGQRPVYRAAEGISVVLHQPDKAGELVSAAIGAGATGLSGPTYFVGDTEAAFAAALGAAFDKARTQATALATRAGATLGPTLTIDEGEGAQLTPQFDAAPKTTAGSGCVTSSPAAPGSGPTAEAPVASKRSSGCTTTPPPTKPGSSTVTATVHVVFALQ